MFKKIIAFYNKFFLIFLIVFLSGILRFFNLGYSDYQGDEIKALFIKDSNVSYSQFFLDQRKGPGQFIITFLTKFIDADYSTEIIHRLPFAIAGFLAVYFFYKLVSLYFGKKIAFFAGFFMLTNGFFIAFSRIVQYQSCTILFMILALYLFSLAGFDQKYKYKGIFWGFIFWALSMLFHYDGIFIAPFAGVLIFNWIKTNIIKNKDKKPLKILIISLVLSGLLLFSFYLPFVINISKNTMEYWEGRISGDVSSKVSSSRYLFSVYHPIYTVHFYTVLAILGLFYTFIIFTKKFTSKYKKITRIVENFDNNKLYLVYFLIWFLVPFIFMEFFIYIPGTHIYTYLLPLFVILSFGLEFTQDVLKLLKKYFIPNIIFYFGLCVLFVFLFLQSYAVFVDSNEEYPWQEEKFLIWNFPNPNPIFHLSMFGFPYYRNWEGIGDAVAGSANNGFYSSNERVSITRYYIPLEKDTENAGHYIHILGSQSFTDKITQQKAVYWTERYHPVFTFSRHAKDLVRVYNMPSGSLEEIIEKGY